MRRYEVWLRSREGTIISRFIIRQRGDQHRIYFLNLAGTIDFKICKEEVDMLTEQEIKAIDERYWAFAVKVEGE